MSPLLFQTISVSLQPVDESRLTNFFAFLQQQASLRPHIRILNISIDSDYFSHRSQATIVSLILSLPRLEQVRFGGSGTPLSYAPRTKLPDKDVLRAIDSHPNRPSIEIDCYAHARNSSLHFLNVTCLRSVKVCLISFPHDHMLVDDHDDGTDERTGGQAVQEIVQHNPRLRHLSICLNKGRQPSMERYEIEQTSVLERIGVSIRQLDSLTLHGYMEFSVKAWDLWCTNFVWENLTYLCFECCDISLARPRLSGRLSSLRTLKIINPSNALLTYMHAYGLKQTVSFLNELQLENLAITENFKGMLLLHIASGSATNLRKIRLHMYGQPEVDGWEEDTGHLCPSLLHGKDLVRIRTACPKLDFLGMDVCMDNLISFKDSTMPLLLHVLEMRELKDLRIFVHGNHNMLPLLSGREAVNMFARLQKQKTGSPLEKLVICTLEGEEFDLWVLTSLEQGRIRTEHVRHKDFHEEIVRIEPDESILIEAKVERRFNYPYWSRDALWAIPDPW